MSAHHVPRTNAEAKTVLEEIVAGHAANVERTLRTIEQNHPADALVPYEAMNVEVIQGANKLSELALMFPGPRPSAPMHDNALQQLAARSELPIKYLRNLQGVPWGRELLATNFNELLRHMDGRALVRTASGERRGILSSSFRRIDSRPLADRIIKVSNEVGGLPVAAHYSDVRVSLRVIAPRVYEPTPGEFIVIGFDWRDSDYGKGANEIDEFVLRLVCVNGMTSTTISRQVHLGRVLTENIFSDETYKLDTAATVSAIGDIVRHALSEEATQGISNRIRAITESPFDSKKAYAALKRDTTKAEVDGIVKLYTSTDIVMLPAGDNAWRWSNAISRFAGTVVADDGDTDRVLELNELAGAVLKAA